MLQSAIRECEEHGWIQFGKSRGRPGKAAEKTAFAGTFAAQIVVDDGWRAEPQILGSGLGSINRRRR